MPDDQGISYQINSAFLGIQRRAEAVDRQTLVETFVDVGALFAVLSSRDHQIVYGRRGTGKTHALLYAAEQARRTGVIPVYIDLRYIGSSGGLYADTNLPTTQRATRLLLDVLGSIHEVLLTFVVDSGLNLAAFGPALDKLAAASTEVQVVGEVQLESTEANSSEEQETGSLKFGFNGKPSLEFVGGCNSKDSAKSETRVSRTGTPTFRVHLEILVALCAKL
jgi:hypothetical protein